MNNITIVEFGGCYLTRWIHPPRSAYVDSIHNASRQYLMSKGKFAFAEKTNVTSRTTELVRCEQRLLDACQGEDTSMPCFLVHSFEEVIHNYNKTPFTRTKTIGTACQISGSVPHLPVPRQPPGGSLGTPKFLITVATLHLGPIRLHVENWECCALKIGVPCRFF